MIVYPAVDIKDGKCVRLLQGRFSDVTVYGENPAEIALQWEKQGGKYLHVVDLDGALKGRDANGDAIKKICAAVSVPVQTGGGVRSMEDIEYKLSLGISRVILGTAAVNDPDFAARAVDKYGEKIVIGIDAKDSYAAVDGWEKISSFKAVDLALKMQSIGVKTIIYTDISTDGTLKGPNCAAMREMAEKTDMDIIASGGVGSVDDIKSLIPTGVSGVIVGRALYTGAVDLAEAIIAAERGV